MCVHLKQTKPFMLTDDAGLNIGVHREAAEHFLAALSFHDRNASDDWDSNINDSGSLWPTLRRALNALVGLLESSIWIAMLTRVSEYAPAG